MSSQEKAAELIVNYQLKCKSLNYDEAKQCALIAVAEILLAITYGDYYYSQVSYWEEVKQEIEKL